MSPYMFFVYVCVFDLNKVPDCRLKDNMHRSTEISFLRSAGLKVRERAKNYHLSKLSYFTDPYCAGVSNMHGLLTFFIIPVPSVYNKALVLYDAITLPTFLNCAVPYFAKL